MKRESKLKAVIIVLVILLAISIAYISIGIYQQASLQNQLDAYQQGAQYGYEQAILQVMQQASTCQPVPLFADNVTINMVAVECLQQLPAG